MWKIITNLFGFKNNLDLYNIKIFIIKNYKKIKKYNLKLKSSKEKF